MHRNVKRALKIALRIAFSMGVIWLLYMLKASRWLRFYPVVMTLIPLSAFALSLRGMPLAERIARKTGHKLDACGVRYCRCVTKLWVAVLALNLCVATATVFASREVWLAWNGCFSYCMTGGVLLGEWLYRRFKACRARG